MAVPGGGLLAKSLIISAVMGVVYGMLWRVLGPLLIIPLLYSKPIVNARIASSRTIIHES